MSNILGAGMYAGASLAHLLGSIASSQGSKEMTEGEQRRLQLAEDRLRHDKYKTALRAAQERDKSEERKRKQDFAESEAEKLHAERAAATKVKEANTEIQRRKLDLKEAESEGEDILRRARAGKLSAEEEALRAMTPGAVEQQDVKIAGMKETNKLTKEKRLGMRDKRLAAKKQAGQSAVDEQEFMQGNHINQISSRAQLFNSIKAQTPMQNFFENIEED